MDAICWKPWVHTNTSDPSPTPWIHSNCLPFSICPSSPTVKHCLPLSLIFLICPTSMCSQLPLSAACLSLAWVGFGCRHSAPGCLSAERPFSPYCNLGHPGQVVSVRGHPPQLLQLQHARKPSSPIPGSECFPQAPPTKSCPRAWAPPPCSRPSTPPMEPSRLRPLNTCGFKTAQGGKGRQQRRRAFFCGCVAFFSWLFSFCFEYLFICVH